MVHLGVCIMVHPGVEGVAIHRFRLGRTAEHPGRELIQGVGVAELVTHSVCEILDSS